MKHHLKLFLVPLFLSLLSCSLFSSNPFEGKLVDVTAVTQGQKSLLWILTDDSWYYTMSSESGNSRSISRECFFCKHILYQYNPDSKKILKSIKLSYDDPPPRIQLHTVGQDLWLLGPHWPDHGPTLIQYDGLSGAQKGDLQSFLKNQPLLARGLAKLDIKENPLRLDLTTRDGRNLLYVFSEKKLYKDPADWREATVAVTDHDPDSEGVSMLVLKSERSSRHRKQVYSVFMPADLMHRRGKSPDSLYKNPRLAQAYARRGDMSLLSPDKAYLEGIFVYQDREGAIILHQDQIGKSAQRLLTRVNPAGKELWSILPGHLFEALMLDEDKAFSRLTFIKSKLKVERRGELLLIRLREAGLATFDFKTGKPLMKLEFEK